MIFKIGKTELKISPLFFILLSLITLFDESGFCVFSLLFSVFHEICHIIMMKLLRYPPNRIAVKFYGLEIYAHVADVKASVLIALFGPIGNIFLFMLFVIFYCFFKIERLIIFAFMNLAIALFNLSPINGLDGGDVISYLLSKKHNINKTEKFAKYIGIVFSSCIILLGILLLLNGNFGLIIVGMYLFILNLIK